MEDTHQDNLQEQFGPEEYADEVIEAAKNLFVATGSSAVGFVFNLEGRPPRCIIAEGNYWLTKMRTDDPEFPGICVEMPVVLCLVLWKPTVEFKERFVIARDGEAVVLWSSEEMKQQMEATEQVGKVVKGAKESLKYIRDIFGGGKGFNPTTKNGKGWLQ